MYPKLKSVDPVDTCFSCNGTPHMACHEGKVLHCALHASILCQSDMCVGLRQFWTANLAAVVVAVAAVDTRPGVPTVVAAFAVNTRRGVWIYCKWYAVPPQGAPQAQCARSATIWASGRTRDPCFEILGAPRGIMVTPSVDFDF